LGIALLGWNVGIAVAAQAWDPVEEATVTSAGGPVDAGGQSLAVFTDVVQPERRVTCAWTVEGKEKATPIPPPSRTLVVRDDGSEWYLIGFELNGRDAMTVSCTPKDKRADNATYAFAVVDGFNSRAQTGNIMVITGTFVGIGLAIWTFIARRRRTHETDLPEEGGDAST
jgi:hypothetical protein